MTDTARGSLSLTEGRARLKDGLLRGVQSTRHGLDRASGAASTSARKVSVRAKEGANVAAQKAKAHPVSTGTLLLMTGAAIAFIAVPPLRKFAATAFASGLKSAASTWRS